MEQPRAQRSPFMWHMSSSSISGQRYSAVPQKVCDLILVSISSLSVSFRSGVLLFYEKGVSGVRLRASREISVVIFKRR